MPSIAVIVPTYKQPKLLAEALNSVLQSRSAGDCTVLVVNDGCPYPETREVALFWQQYAPDRILYFEKENSGLSAARNFGIDFILSALPDAKYIYFLDSDNRVGLHTLEKLRNALHASPNHVGWAYTDLVKFGVAEMTFNGGEYSALEHMRDNTCDAGSLVRREVVERGLRFDSNIPGGGYEDWLFWLEAHTLGYVGAHVSDAGFKYRKRPHSLVADANSSRSAKATYFREKLPELFGKRRLNWLNKTEARQVLVVSRHDLAGAYLNDQNIMPTERWTEDLMRSETDPGFHLGPRFMVVLAQTLAEVNWQTLVDAIWHLRVLLADASWAGFAEKRFKGLQRASELQRLLAGSGIWMARSDRVLALCRTKYRPSSHVRIETDDLFARPARTSAPEDPVIAHLRDVILSDNTLVLDTLLPNGHRRSAHGRRRALGKVLRCRDTFPVFPDSKDQSLIAVLVSRASDADELTSLVAALRNDPGRKVLVFCSDRTSAQSLQDRNMSDVHCLEFLFEAGTNSFKRSTWLRNSFAAFEHVIDFDSGAAFDTYSDLKIANCRLTALVTRSSDLQRLLANEAAIEGYVVPEAAQRLRLMALGVPDAKVASGFGFHP